jgi:hypothetical protein
MKDTADAQKSEVHESTDDASSSPASNARQHTDSPAQGQGRSQSNFMGKTAPGTGIDKEEVERHRTNVAGVSPAEADDFANAPPGHVDLKADLSKDKPLYPTAKPGAEKAGKAPQPDQSRQNLSP